MHIRVDTERQRAMRKSWAEKKAAKLFGECVYPIYADAYAHALTVEHRRAVRIIKRLKQKAYFVEDTMDADQFDAYIAALDDVLAALERGRK